MIEPELIVELFGESFGVCNFSETLGDPRIADGGALCGLRMAMTAAG